MSQLNIPHINLSSYPGGGKTTVTIELLKKPDIVLLPKYTTRPQRPVEEIPEYIFVTEKEFNERKNSQQFIAVEEIKRFGKTHYHAIPKPDFWPIIPTNTKIILSIFGVHASLVKEYVPHMKLCFIDFKNKEILKKRLYERCLTDNSDYDSKLKVIEEYLAKNLAGNYEHIIYNDYSLDYTLKQIDKLVFSKEIILQ